MPAAPATVGLTFGSFGDIATILQFAWQIRAVLHETAGARAEIDALKDDVDAFTRALQDSQSYIERHRMKLPPDVQNGIAAAHARCRAVLGEINRTVDQCKGKDSKWAAYRGALSWSVRGRKQDVEMLRKRLLDQIAVIQTYLALYKSTDLEAAQAEARATRAAMVSISGTTRALVDGVPSFQFYDVETNTYCQPLARASLPRLDEIYELCNGVRLRTAIEAYFDLPFSEFIESRTMPVETVLYCGNRTEDADRGSCRIQCLFFRKHPLSDWQVLIGAGPSSLSRHDTLRLLFYRKHSLHERCNCNAPCQRSVFGDEWLRGTVGTYTLIASLPWFKSRKSVRWGPFLKHTLYAVLRRWPDPEYLRTKLLPVADRQGSSRQEWLQILKSAPPSDKYTTVDLGFVLTAFSSKQQERDDSTAGDAELDMSVWHRLLARKSRRCDDINDLPAITSPETTPSRALRKAMSNSSSDFESDTESDAESDSSGV